MALDSFPGYDTTNFDFRILRAYFQNDSITLLNVKKQIESDRQYKKESMFMDSCINQPVLQKLNKEEAYRFIYYGAFCPYTLNITVSKSVNNFNLHFIIYRYAWDTLPCQVIREYDKKLTNKQWNEIQKALAYADFWGLKQDNGKYGCDRSTLRVEGFLNEKPMIEPAPKYHFISRWVPTPSATDDAFDLVLKISGNNRGVMLRSDRKLIVQNPIGTPIFVSSPKLSTLFPGKSTHTHFLQTSNTRRYPHRNDSYGRTYRFPG